MTLTRKAYAKINLSLDIISKMDDGYHYLKTIMQTVGLCDEITITLTPDASPAAQNPISIDISLSYLPNDERNIATQAASAFYEHTGITGYQTNIQIDKKIPVCAGMGGGSSDAACVLRMLDEMLKTGLGRETLEKIGYSVGADVPFCIDGGTKLAEGRGEILTDLPAMPKSPIVICKPPFSCSTPELFSRVDCKKICIRPDTDGLISALKNGDIGGVARRMYNVFEDVLPRIRPDIDAIKGVLLEYGALGAVMTGSGPTVFGLFKNEDNAQNAYGELAKTYEECFLTETVNPSFEEQPHPSL